MIVKILYNTPKNNQLVNKFLHAKKTNNDSQIFSVDLKMSRHSL